MRIRKITMGATALAFSFGILAVAVAPGVASAKTLKTGTGTYNCTDITGTISFSPPLTLNGSTTANDTVSVATTSTGCTGGSPAVTTTSNTGTVVVASQNCSSLESAGAIPPITLTDTYKKATASTYTASTSDKISSSGKISFKLTGPVTGSYPSSKASAKAKIQQTESALAAECAGTGLASLNIASGTSTGN
jgi:hypothetical protein